MASDPGSTYRLVAGPPCSRTIGAPTPTSSPASRTRPDPTSNGRGSSFSSGDKAREEYWRLLRSSRHARGVRDGRPPRGSADPHTAAREVDQRADRASSLHLAAAARLEPPLLGAGG